MHLKFKDPQTTILLTTPSELEAEVDKKAIHNAEFLLLWLVGILCFCLQFQQF